MKKRFTYLLVLSICLVTYSYGQFTSVTGITGGRIKALAAKDSYVFAGVDGSGGVYRSADYGSTWSLCAGVVNGITPLGLKFVGSDIYCGAMGGGCYKSTDNGITWNRVVLSPSFSGYVNDFATDGTRIYTATTAGVFISADNGTTWILSNTGLTSLWIYKLVITGSKIFAATNNGVFLSTDNGTNWIAANTGISDKQIYALLYNGSVLYAGTNASIYTSSDDGTTWTLNSNNLSAGSVVYELLVNGTKIYTALYGADASVYSRELSAIQWVQSSSGITTTNAYSLASSGSYIFVGTIGGGVFRSSDNGATWVYSSTGLCAAEVKSIYVDGVNVYVGTAGNGIFKSTDEGATWSQINTGLTDFNITAVYANGSTVYAVALGKIFKSTNEGNTWNVISAIGGFCFAVKGTNLFFGTWPRVFKSTDDGVTWAASGTGMPQITIINMFVNGNDIYASCDTDIFRSTDDGATWTASTGGIHANEYLKGIAAINNNIFIGSWSNYVYRSQDNGANWTIPSTEMLHPTVYSLLAFNNTIYAGGVGSHIYRSNNLGNSWTDIGNGINGFSYIYSLAKSGTKMFVGTTSAGLWSRPLSEVVVANEKEAALPNSYSLQQNYPNPFNPSTNIKYSLPEASNVTIKVYDLMGREVAALINEYKPAGNYNVKFNASNLASGIYYYQLTAKSTLQTKKMILIK